MTHRSLQIACLFLAGILQSAAFVLIPALGNILTSAPYDFSSSAYALLLLGVGFGWTLAAINHYSALFFLQSVGEHGHHLAERRDRRRHGALAAGPVRGEDALVVGRLAARARREICPRLAATPAGNR
ncbi:MAG TPA: hypothetical protein PK555_02635 [Steroidobacteraceae bacterium]|nr:hypothetical protein [Steroidobacteraceae bacterium]